MNLYLLLAIAIGAIAGTTEAPVARPGFAAVVARSAVRAERQVIRSATAALRTPERPRVTVVAPRAAAPAAAPLTGAITPRAPAA